MVGTTRFQAMMSVMVLFTSCAHETDQNLIPGPDDRADFGRGMEQMTLQQYDSWATLYANAGGELRCMESIFESPERQEGFFVAPPEFRTAPAGFGTNGPQSYVLMVPGSRHVSGALDSVTLLFDSSEVASRTAELASQGIDPSPLDIWTQGRPDRWIPLYTDMPLFGEHCSGCAHSPLDVGEPLERFDECTSALCSIEGSSDAPMNLWTSFDDLPSCQQVDMLDRSPFAYCCTDQWDDCCADAYLAAALYSWRHLVSRFCSDTGMNTCHRTDDDCDSNPSVEHAYPLSAEDNPCVREICSDESYSSCCIEVWESRCADLYSYLQQESFHGCGECGSEVGQACCSNGRCVDGLMCDDQSNSCIQCGIEDAPCCPGLDQCGSNALRCEEGICAQLETARCHEFDGDCAGCLDGGCNYCNSPGLVDLCWDDESANNGLVHDTCSMWIWASFECRLS